MSLATQVVEDLDQEADSSGRALDPVGARLADISDQLGGWHVIEAADGTVVAHAARSGLPSAPVAAAVLARRSTPLHAAATQRRTALVLPTGPVQQLCVADADALLVPLTAAGRLGWWWIVGGHLAADDVRVPEHAAMLASHLSWLAANSSEHQLTALLEGRGELPAHMTGRQLRIAVVRALGRPAPGVPAILRQTLHDGASLPTPVLIRDSTRGADLLLASDACLTSHLQRWLARASDQTHQTLTAGLSDPVPDVDGLAAAYAQAEAIVTSAPAAHRCVTWRDARAAVSLDEAGAALSAPPIFGQDHVTELIDLDIARRTELARSLLAWLDAGGRTPIAAKKLFVHTNTMRYRVRKALENLDVDVDDPDARLDVHLRLRWLLRSAAQK